MFYVEPRRLAEAGEALERARRLVERIASVLERGFERGIRSGELEEAFTMLAAELRVVVSSGLPGLEGALERAELLASYAHAIRVRLLRRPEGQMLSREYNDFVRHLGYIDNAISEAQRILSALSIQPRSGGGGGGRPRGRPGGSP